LKDAIVLAMLVRPRLAAAALVLAPTALGFNLAVSQTADRPKTPFARVFHPAAPLPSYDVATIKPFDPAPVQGEMRQLANTTIRSYIAASAATK
jgi:hypothetical protein